MQCFLPKNKHMLTWRDTAKVLKASVCGSVQKVFPKNNLRENQEKCANTDPKTSAVLPLVQNACLSSAGKGEIWSVTSVCVLMFDWWQASPDNHSFCKGLQLPGDKSIKKKKTGRDCVLCLKQCETHYTLYMMCTYFLQLQISGIRLVGKTSIRGKS